MDGRTESQLSVAKYGALQYVHRAVKMSAFALVCWCCTIIIVRRNNCGVLGKDETVEGTETTTIQTVQKQKAKSFSTQINHIDCR